jgi:hypothetical protein
MGALEVGSPNTLWSPFVTAEPTSGAIGPSSSVRRRFSRVLLNLRPL